LKAFIIWPSEFSQAHEAMEACKDKGNEEFVVVVIGWPKLGYDGVQVSMGEGKFVMGGYCSQAFAAI
jgi:hypothetical protein